MHHFFLVIVGKLRHGLVKEFAQGQTRRMYQRGPKLMKHIAATFKQSFYLWVVNLDLFICWELPRLCPGLLCLCGPVAEALYCLPGVEGDPMVSRSRRLSLRAKR